MSNLKDSPKFAVHNDYYTPKSAWENVQHLIGKDKTIYEAFMFNSKSKSPDYFNELGYKVIYDREVDFLDDEKRLTGYDIIVSNPPFETKLKQDILRKLVEIDKPFLIIMNSMNTFSKYMRSIFKGHMGDLQLITPDGKIQFDKLEDGVIKKTNNCSFYCVYVCYKMNLDSEKLWL